MEGLDYWMVTAKASNTTTITTDASSQTATESRVEASLQRFGVLVGGGEILKCV